ncbi:UNVERIFIED_CONTAM: hypothetical protein RMT77_010986 [Armadillidium vulgare]
MEEIVTCSICTKVFDSLHLIPKMIECGHTFCSPCLTKLFQNNPSCPNCRAEIKGTESSLPINYIALKIVDIYKSKNWSESEMDITAEVTKRKDIILQKKAQMTSSIEVFDKCLEKLEKLTVSESERIGTVNVKRILNEVDEDLKKTDDVVRCDDLKKSMSFLLSNFEDSKEYLLEIYKRLQNEEKVFAVHKINDDVKYGKILLCGNQLFFYSLSLSEVPKDSLLIWFEDVKQCLNYKNFNTFINICCNEKNVTQILIIEMFDRHLCNQFIKLCTGECGPSYKGSSYSKDCIYDKEYRRNCFDMAVRVKKFVENECETNRLVEYKYCGEESNTCSLEENQALLFLNSDGSFDIVRCLKTVNTNWKQSFGRVISPPEFYKNINYQDSSYLKVFDSGILFTI